MGPNENYIIDNTAFFLGLLIQLHMVQRINAAENVGLNLLR
jgi:hypothetical protein